MKILVDFSSNFELENVVIEGIDEEEMKGSCFKNCNIVTGDDLSIPFTIKYKKKSKKKSSLCVIKTFCDNNRTGFTPS